MKTRIITLSAAAAALVAAGLATAAISDERYPPVSDAMTKKECGECHMAFQPAFLPARSWEKIMDNLSDHFGEDASLPKDKAEHIKKYLMANAADRRWGSKMMRGVRKDWTPIRITELPYWKHEHEEEVPARAWKDPKVGSKANCKACHRYADTGIYEAEEYEYGGYYGRKDDDGYKKKYRKRYDDDEYKYKRKRYDDDEYKYRRKRYDDDDEYKYRKYRERGEGYYERRRYDDDDD